MAENDKDTKAADTQATEVEKSTDNTATEDALVKGIQAVEKVAELLEKGAKIPESEDINKGLKDGSDEIRKGVEVSNFLADIVSEVGDHLSGMNSSMSKAVDTQSTAIKELGDVIKSMASEIISLREAVGKIDTKPAASRKAITKSVERFEGDEAGGSTNLTKSQIAERMTGLVLKGKATAADVLQFESTGKMRDEVFDIIFAKKEVQ